MNEIETIADNLRQEISNFLVPIQTSKVIKKNHFQSILSAVELLASQLKGIDLVSKSLLNEIFVTVKILRAEASHFGSDEATLIDMAGKLEYVFELILKDETSDQRQPGVPRII